MQRDRRCLNDSVMLVDVWDISSTTMRDRHTELMELLVTREGL